VQLPTQTISLCDTVPVTYEKLGVTFSAKVIKTDFNVLTERYNSIEVGTAKKPLGKILAQTAKGAGVSVYT
jgi:phage-related protein